MKRSNPISRIVVAPIIARLLVLGFAVWLIVKAKQINRRYPQPQQ